MSTTKKQTRSGTSSRSSSANKSTKSKSSSTSSRSTGTGKSSSSRSTSNRKSTNQPTPLRREIGALVCLLLAVFSGLGYFNSKAIFINLFSNLLKGLYGYGFWFAPPALLITSLILLFHRGRPVKRRVISALLLPYLFGGLLHVLLANGEFTLTQVPGLWKSGLELSSGGVISGWCAVLFSKVFSRIGASVLFLLALLFCNMTITKITPADVWDGVRSGFAAINRYIHSRPQYEEPEDDWDAYDGYDGYDEPEPVVSRRSSGTSGQGKRTKGEVQRTAAVPVSRRGKRSDIDIPVDDEDALPLDTPAERPDLFDSKPRVRPPHEVLKEQAAVEGNSVEPAQTPEDTEPGSDFLSELDQRFREFTGPEDESGTESAAAPAKPVRRTKAKQPVVLESVRKLSPEEAASVKQKKSQAAVDAEKARKGVDSDTYKYPPLDLLEKGSGVSNADAAAELQQTRELLDDTIQSFGIDARIINVTRGPSITRYELELMRGVKLSKLTNLSDDIALALGAPSVRIAPITGRNSVVGIEVPNQLVASVPIKEVIGSREFNTHVSKVAFALGKDISGKNIVGNIAKLPHLLIAGTTGSGKSVCTNSLVVSLLYKASPEDVRLIMVDPKVVEFSVYNGIPHLLIPVVTDPKKAAGALQWAVTEMMKRYRAFSEVGARDLASYNAYMLSHDQKDQKMPQIVVIIDELADLMLVAAKEVEESICRVAQMGRAAGMHLIIATQRPSSDVITGLMKANIPSRIALSVASSLESRIILDTTGAEKLVGNGDMLYAPLGIGKPLRVQGCLITDEEIAKVVSFVKENCSENYDDSIMEEVESNAQNTGKKGKDAQEPTPGSGGNRASTEGSAAEMDELLPAAVEVVVDTGMASVSMLQRRLKLGYSRAARLVDQMEERHIVGPFEGSKPRQVLISKEEWAKNKAKYLGDEPVSEAGIQADEFAAALAMSEAADAAEADAEFAEEDEAPF